MIRKELKRKYMTKEELEEMVEKEKIMSMKELKLILKRENMIKSTDQIIKTIVVDEIQKIGKREVFTKNEVKKYIKNFSPATAQRQIEELRAGRMVWGPRPNSLTQNTKAYYPMYEVAAVMYIQSHVASAYGRPSLKRILETRHD